MTFLDEVDPLNEKNDIKDKESSPENIDSNNLVETLTPKIDKAQTVENNKITSSKPATSPDFATDSKDSKATTPITKISDTPVAISKVSDTASLKAVENNSFSSKVIISKNVDSDIPGSKTAESKIEEDAETKPTKRFTKPDPFAETAPTLTKRQKKKLEQQMLLKESIRVREETQYVSGLGRRRHRETSKGEKDNSAPSSVVSTPSISKPEVNLSSITESQNVISKVKQVDIPKPKKSSKRFKKVTLDDLDNLDDLGTETFEPAWANEKSGVHSVADEVAKLSNEFPKVASKEVSQSKVSPTMSPASNVLKQKPTSSFDKAIFEVADVKPSAKTKPITKDISKNSHAENVKETIEQALLSASGEENLLSLESSTKEVASKSLDKKAISDNNSTKEVNSIEQEVKSDTSANLVTSSPKKSKAAKQKKEDPVEAPILPTEKVTVSDAGLDFDEDDELIDTIVDPEFIEDLVNRTLQTTSSNLPLFFNTNPQFITQNSPTFSSSEFESYTPDTDISTEEISMDALCKLLSPNAEIKGNVSLEQAEEYLKQSKKMLENLEASFVDSVNETVAICKNFKKAVKQ